jgi:hypothetical protein
MNHLSRPLFFASLCLLSLTGCWVPQIMQGVQPNIFPSSATPAPVVSTLSAEEMQVAMASRLVSASRDLAAMMLTTRRIGERRQQIENHIFFNVKSGLPDWTFINGSYQNYDIYRGNIMYLSFLNSQGQAYSWDVLDVASYGNAPRPGGKTYPADNATYELKLAQRSVLNNEGALSATVIGTWPRPIPIQGNFATDFRGTGQVSDLPWAERFDLAIDARVGTTDPFNVQVSMEVQTRSDRRVYNAFGQIDARGLTGTVNLLQNGLSQLQIVRIDNRWELRREDRIVASIS